VVDRIPGTTETDSLRSTTRDVAAVAMQH
jgi:hypothetical protein